jgi:ABC-type nickel/cobalt efflux system permease component RcnA
MEIDLTNAGLWTLMIATFTLAVSHSINPDHWFPFVMVGRANKWKISWVLALAVIAGIGHVGTSVVIGLVGVFVEKGTSKEIAIFLENATPVLLIVFGFSYAAYHLYKQQVGVHGHTHGIPIINKWLGIDPHVYDLPDHEHDHTHDTHGHDHGEHGHSHDHHKNGHNHYHQEHGRAHEQHEHGTQEADLKGKRSGWALVAIIGLTPCIALLPLTMASVKYGTMAIILVNVSFAIATIGTIVLLTWFGLMGLSWIKLEFFEKNGDVIAGLIIGFIGVAVKVFEL